MYDKPPGKIRKAVWPQAPGTYNQVVEALIKRQMQQIRNVGELSRIVSQTHREISSTMMDSYQQRQQVYDKISDNFSRHIRGVEAYHDPVENREVELPSGYDLEPAASPGFL